jgi:nucleoid DNA-binding protein
MKPQSMTLKEWLIKKMAVNMVIPEKTIDAVITHQFDSANDAVNIHKSVEIAGFGKFYFNQKKADRQYEKLIKIKEAYERMLLDENITDKKRNAVILKIQIVNSSIKSLKPKVNEYKPSNRGMEKPSTS